LAEIGGAVYLIELSNSVVTVINASDYGEIIIDLYHRRAVSEVLDKAHSEVRLFDPESNAMTVIEGLEAKLSEIANSGPERRPLVSASAAMVRATASAEAAVKRGGPIGITTGLVDLDRQLGGLQKSDLIILAGRPSMGKTALATSMGKGSTDQGHKLCFFSIEMSAEQLGQRFIAMETGISVDRQRSGFASEKDIEAMVNAGQSLDSTPFWIDDDAMLTVQAMTSKARRLQRQQGLDLVIIDHLGLTKTARGERYSGLYERTTAIVRGTKTMAKVLGVPVILLVQLSRAVEQREDKRPMLSDLRDSGAIEEEADVVMFVYRDAYYLERSEPKPRSDEEPDKFSRRMLAHSSRLEAARNMGEVLVAKNRQGALGTVKLHFDGPRQLFSNLHQGE
jgi:replicative DNA helicase